MIRADMLDGLPDQMAVQDGPTLEQLARGCRIAQKRYFNDRSPANLQIAKDCESLLDKALAALEAARVEPDLFEVAS